VTRLLGWVFALAVSVAVPAAADTVRYILPPGNFGGIPFTAHSTDQLPLYTGLSPLRDQVTPTDIDNLYLPEDFTPIGATQAEILPSNLLLSGLQVLYDSYGIPHVYAQTRYQLAYGAGWTTARDRGLLLQFGRNPAYVAVADVPNIDAFSLVTGLQSFTPSPAAIALVDAQIALIQQTYGAKGDEIVTDAAAYADGINGYYHTHNVNQPDVQARDVIAVTAFIGSIFGAGGGSEAANADLLAKLQAQLGTDMGSKAWSDLMLADDPEAPTTITRRFRYGVFTGGPVQGSVVLDASSIQSIDPRVPPSMAGLAPAHRQASNFLVVSPKRSASGNSLAVMGPQLGYFYPEIVQQIDLHGPGINAQGVAVPGLAMYILIGRTQNYAWSLTSADNDVRDVYAEQLCEPDNSPPTRTSTHYLFNGQCRAFDVFDAGTLGTNELVYNVSVHGPVFATATVNGQPYALSRRRSTFGRDGLNLAALKDLTEGRATTPSRFWRIANEFGFTFNWAYVSRTRTAYFSSGLLPRRAAGLDRRLPTLGTGAYEWSGFLGTKQHPHDVAGPGGLLLNWNNRAAPGFMHGDDTPFGSIHRVLLFNRFPAAVQLTDDVGIMNRAATGDVRSLAWPVVSRVLHMGTAPSALDGQVVGIVDDWVSRDAPRLDANNDTYYDEPGPAIMDALWRPIVEAVLSPVLGPLIPDVDNVRSLGSVGYEAYAQPGESYVDKDLRTLLGDPVVAPFNLRYCGLGALPACEAALWQTVDQVASALATQQGTTDPTQWKEPASLTGFVPGLLPNTFTTIDRSTFQQVIEFDR
jgi:penicillin amidase